MLNVIKIYNSSKILFFLFIALSVTVSSERLILAGEQLETKHIDIRKIEGWLNIDGILAEREWSEVPVIGQLTEVEPKEGAVSPRLTEVKILYNGEYLYFGIVCYHDPADIVAFQMERDSEPEFDDYIGITLDTFFDKRNCYLFCVSPVGMRYDAVVTNNGIDINDDWDGIWYAKSKIGQNAWVVEVAIPFKTLSFNPDQSVWGFNFIRFTKRFEQLEKWAYPFRDSLPYNPAQAGELRGLEGMEQGIGLDVRPYLLADGNKLEPEVEAEFKPDTGLDVFYNITSNLKASFTFDTDFAETEVDHRQINLTRFPIFFPEKRDFFLDGSGMFELPRMISDLIPFLTRRVGMYEEQKVPIRWGMKVTGRLGQYNIGFLDVQTENTDLLDGQNLLALRITRNLWEQSHIGMIFTNGNPSGTGYNRLYGVDFRYGTSKLFGDKNLFISTNYLVTDDENLPDEDSSSWKVSLDYPNDLIDATVNYWEIGQNFNPALGYLRRPGIRNFMGHITVSPRPDIEWVRQFHFMLYGSAAWDSQGNIAESYLIFQPLGVNFESGDYLGFEINRKFELIDENFEISDGIIIPPAGYTDTRYSVDIESSSKRNITASLELSWGDYYGGTGTEMNARLAYKPDEHLYLSGFGWMNDAELPWGSFVARIYGANVIIKLSPDLSCKSIIQYDNFSKVLGIYYKLRWILEEGNELYFVVQHNWEKENGAFKPYNWQVDLKFYYTFRF